MAKNNKNSERIIETEEVPIEETIEVEAPEELKEITLVINIAFTDKYTGVNYKVNDKIPFEKARAIELLEDPRNLVSKVGD